jgi:hypothetical protein
MKFMTSMIEKGTHATSKDYERLLSLNGSYSVNAELKNKVRISLGFKIWKLYIKIYVFMRTNFHPQLALI